MNFNVRGYKKYVVVDGRSLFWSYISCSRYGDYNWQVIAVPKAARKRTLVTYIATSTPWANVVKVYLILSISECSNGIKISTLSSLYLNNYFMSYWEEK